MSRFVFLTFLYTLFACTSAQAALIPPSGYLKAAAHTDETDYNCPVVPQPFTGVLDFPSKYFDTDSSHDKINPATDTEYKAKTQNIDVWEKGVSKLVDKYMQSGNPTVLACAVNWITVWSDADALDNTAKDYTGMAVRKWALASVAGSYMRLKFSSSVPLRAYPEQSKHIDAWLGRLADKVVSEWHTNDPKHKVNNHYYWAAWSVMATSIILDRKDLFDWSLKIYDIFASQVDKDGYLPYELARKTRAFSYHEFAITPLSMIAAFAKANGVDAASKGNNALGRLAGVIFAGMDNIAVFEVKTGATQNLDDAESKTKRAWLEPYCSIETCPDSIKHRLQTERPLRNSLLGGNITSVFAGR